MGLAACLGLCLVDGIQNHRGDLGIGQGAQGESQDVRHLAGAENLPSWMVAHRGEGGEGRERSPQFGSGGCSALLI